MQRDPRAGIATMVLGAGIALNAVLGPLMLGVIRVRESPGMEKQLVGGEVTSLFVAAPLALAASVLWFRGSRAAPALTAGPAGYALYMYVQFILVPDYTRYDGNSERWFMLYLTLVLLGWTLLWHSWRELGANPPPPVSPHVTRLFGALLIVPNIMFALAWFTTIAQASQGRFSTEYLEHPTAFWLIRLMDLGFLIPIGLVTGFGLVRLKPWGTRALYTFGGVQALLACAVAGMMIHMRIPT